MVLAASSIKRAVDASGDDVRTFLDTTIDVPGTALVGDAGEHVGIDAAPLITGLRALSKSSTGGALQANHDAKNVAGTFFRVHCDVDAGTGQVYLMLFDLAAPPGGGAVPIMRGQRVASFSDGDTHYWEIIVPEGLAMANGIQVAVSTTLATLTAAGSVATFDVFFL